MKFSYLLFLTLVTFIFSSCKKDNPVSPEVNPNFDAKLVATWFDSANNDGIQIRSDGGIIILEVNEDGRLVASSDQSNAPKLIEAKNGIFIMHKQHNNLVDTLSGTFEISDTTMTMTIEKINGIVQNNPIINNYVKSSIDALVVLKEYLSAKISSSTITFNYVTLSYSNQTLIFGGGVSFQGSLSIRGTIQGIGNYNLNEQNKAVYVNANGIQYSTDENHIGSLNIKTFNTQKKYISGTFSFTGSYNGNTINVENGKFGGVY